MQTPNVAIVTDSVSCLTPELVDQYRIEIIPLILYAGGKIYRDGVDITPSEAYEIFLKDPDSFKTSAASPEECFQILRRASQKARNVLCITLSTSLSTVYNAAQEAREIARTELPDVNIEVLDSQSATPSEGFIVLEAARAAAEGKELAALIGIVENMKGRVNAIVFLDTIRHAYRSGRIPKVASQIGSALSIKPIMVVKNKVHFAGAVRNREHGIERMLQMMSNKVGQSEVHVAVMHAYAREEAEKLKTRIASEFKCIELWVAEFSPIMGYACGTGTVGIAFYTE